MVSKVALAGRLGLEIQSFSIPSFGKSDFRHIVLCNAESLSKLSLIQVDEVLVPRSLENTMLANPLNLLNLDLVRMRTTPPKRLRVQSSWAFNLWTFKTGFLMDKQRTNSSTPHLHPKSLELALNSFFVKNVCLFAKEYSFQQRSRSCSKILARRQWIGNSENHRKSTPFFGAIHIFASQPCCFIAP